MSEQRLSAEELAWAVEHYHPSALEGAAFRELQQARATIDALTEERDRLRRVLEAVKRHADTPGKEELHHYNGDIHAPNCPGCRLREFVTRALAAPEGRDD